MLAVVQCIVHPVIVLEKFGGKEMTVAGTLLVCSLLHY